MEGNESSERHVMDGLVQGSKEVDTYTCNVVMINLSREIQTVSKGSELGSLTELDTSDFAPIQEARASKSGKSD